MRLRRPSVVPTACLGVLVVLAATVAVNVAPVAAHLTHRPLHATAPVTEDPVAAPFRIEYFGLSAKLAAGSPPPAEHFGEVRFHRQGTWSSWQPLGEDGAQGEDQFTASLVSVAHADGYQLRGLPAAFRDAHATVLNLNDGPVTSRSTELGQPASAASACSSRADWNADESITAWSKGTDTMAFAPDQVVTVHHTAGSNDPTQNYAQTVLAIEQYHVLTNGWSDIGYHYLIDPKGVVYEGRNSGHTSTSCVTAAGDGSDFAHRPSDDAIVTGAHTGGYNTGNVGIAMIGCFDSADATCTPGKYGTNDTVPTAAANSALEQLLARLAARHGLNPTGTVNYANATNTKPGVATFTGHRDWEATACPGGNVYAQLPTLRTKVAADLAPVGLQASTTSTSAHLSWSPGASWPGAPRATKYRVRRGGTVLGDTAALMFDDSGLSPGTTYTYDVSSVATDGTTSSPATTVTASTGTGASGPDFTIAVSPSADTASAGSTRTPTITTTATAGTSTVTITTSVQPVGNGITSSVGSSSISAGSTDPLTVSTTPATPAGTYTVTVTGTSASTSHTATYTVSVTNQPPSAAITLAISPCTGASCTFTGTGRDPEGGGISLAWSMPSGSPATGSGTSSTTTYSGPGTYTVTLTATDPASLTGRATATVVCTSTGKGKTKTLSCTASTP